MIGRLNLSGGLDINGIIEEYKVYSGGNVSAGDFVSFINELEEMPDGNVVVPGVDTQLSFIDCSGLYYSAVQLTENKIFIAHGRSTVTGEGYLYGLIVTIANDGTMTPGTDTQLNSTNVAEGISVVRLAENRVFICYGHTDEKYYLTGMVVTIANDGTMTPGTPVSLSTTVNSGYRTSAIQTAENKVFIAHTYGTNDYLYGIMVTIASNGTITKNTDTKISASTGADIAMQAIKLTDTQIFIAHSCDDSDEARTLYGVLITITSSGFTKGTDTLLSSTDFSGYHLSIVRLTDNKIFLAHSYKYSYYLYGMVVTIASNGTISHRTDTQLSTSTSLGQYLRGSLQFMEGKVLITYNQKMHAMVVTIANDGTITPGIDSLLIDNNYSQNALIMQGNDNKIYIFHYLNTGYYLHVMSPSIAGYVTNAKTLSSGEIIRGVAKKSGNSGDTIDVFVPDLN